MEGFRQVGESEEKHDIHLRGDDMKTEIVCAYCGRLKPYPDDFPNMIYAMCAECVEKEAKERERKKARLWHNRFLVFIKKLFKRSNT